ncbi:MAG: hypothetical protein COA86_08615 [Kangiella sp.]|nr:MAG: hypothetical protein COA86_08615 [Kangiella sp.]
MKLKNIALLAMASFLLTACGGSKVKEQVAAAPVKPRLPAWVTFPLVEDGLADTQCVENNAGMSLLKTKATTLARVEIAKQINVKVKAMDKSYQSLTTAADGSSEGSSFESVSKSITQQSLSGTRAVKLDYVDFPDGTTKICVMVTMNPALTKNVFNNIIEKSGRTLSAQSDDILYQQFKAERLEGQMDAELDKQ